MKNRKFKNYLKVGILLFILSVSLENCENNQEQHLNLYHTDSEQLNLKTVSFEDAKSFFKKKNNEEYKDRVKYARKSGESPLELKPNWQTIQHSELFGIDTAELTLADINVNREGNYISKLFFINQNNTIKSVIFTIYQKQVAEDGKILEATMYFNELNGKFLDGYIIEEGTITKRLVVTNPKNIQKAALFLILQKEEVDDCWNTDTLDYFEGGQLGEVIISTSGGSGSSAPYFGNDHSTGGISAATSGNSNHSGGGANYTSITSLAGAIYANNQKTLAEGESECPNGYIYNNGICEKDDKIINELSGKERCIYEKLKKLNLFIETVKKFENNNTYNLKIVYANCTNTDEACTDGSLVADGIVKIKVETRVGNYPLSFAATLLHEGIHAEIFKYVDEYKKGLDPNKRENLLSYYFQYKSQNDNTLATAEAQHQHMADKFVTPIAQAIRTLDNYSYPLEYYMGFGWDGLRKYGYDGYYDNGNWVNLTKTQSSDYYKKQKTVNDNTKLNSNECN